MAIRDFLSRMALNRGVRAYFRTASVVLEDLRKQGAPSTWQTIAITHETAWVHTISKHRVMNEPLGPTMTICLRSLVTALGGPADDFLEYWAIRSARLDVLNAIPDEAVEKMIDSEPYRRNKTEEMTYGDRKIDLPPSQVAQAGYLPALRALREARSSLL